MIETKYCPACKEILPIINFAIHRKSKDGYQYWCKPCKLNKQYEWMRKNPHKETEYRIRLNYKMEPEEYAEFIKNGCEVCGSMEKLCVDHDHRCCPTTKSCGKCIRGVLCKACNEAEGKLKSDTKIVKSLLTYMEKWEKNNG